MGDEITVAGVLVGALTGGVTILAKEVGQYFVKRRLEERDVAYQAAIDLLTTVRAVTHVFEKSASCCAPCKHEDLVTYPNSWPMRPPSLEVRALISAFDDPELHRELMLIADRHAAYADCSLEHRKAFDWLLEHENEDWSVSVSARERLGTLNDQRNKLTVNARAILMNSHSALRRLVIITKRWPTWRTDRYTALVDLMTARYGLTLEALELAALYYSNGAVSLQFDACRKWVLLDWDGGLSVVPIQLVLIGGGTFPSPVDLQPGTRMLVPAGVTIADAFIGATRVKLNYSYRALKSNAEAYKLISTT
jgi:hypothetical protein